MNNVAVVGAVCILIGWLLASTIAPPVARVQSRQPERPASVNATDDMPFTAQLRWQVRQAPLPEGRRNPFEFAATDRQVTSAAAALGTTAIPLDPTPDTIAPSGPSFTLSGIGIKGEVRTAILSVGDSVYVLEVDDTLDGYRVLNITDSSVTLERAGEKTTLHFR